jgi:transketolase
MTEPDQRNPACEIRAVAWPGPADVERVALGMRRRTLETVIRRRGGYLIQTCSSAEILATLCLALSSRGHDPNSSTSGRPRRHSAGSVYLNQADSTDHRLVASPAHYALALYTAFVEIGRLPESALDAYGNPDSPLELIGADYSPGFEVVGGSLGQGLSQAVGIALGRRRHGDSGRTFVLLSDGEMQEGQTWEAVQAARHHEVTSLTIVIDANGQQIDGDIGSVMAIEQIEERLAAFGADVTVVDGHDVPRLTEALSRKPTDRPPVIVARTNPAQHIEPISGLAPRRRHGLWFTSDPELTPFIDALVALTSTEERNTRGPCAEAV